MKIKDKLKEIRAANRIGLMGHIVASFPSYNDSIEAASGICEGGADLLEVQFPFSDPSADGPTIEGASYRALDAGFKTAQGFEIVRNLATSTKTAILIMTYGNIVYRYGVEKFVDKALECGAAGLIIPDFPPELDENLIEICRQKGLDNVLIAAPGADADRVKFLSQKTHSMLYTVVRRGITGKKTEIAGDVVEWLNLVKTNSAVPIAAGFGIQSKDQIDALKGKADVAVVGSYLVEQIDAAVRNKQNIRNVLRNIIQSMI